MMVQAARFGSLTVMLLLVGSFAVAPAAAQTTDDDGYPLEVEDEVIDDDADDDVEVLDTAIEAEDDAALPVTGIEAFALAGIAVVAMALGAGLLVAARRRRATTPR